MYFKLDTKTVRLAVGLSATLRTPLHRPVRCPPSPTVTTMQISQASAGHLAAYPQFDANQKAELSITSGYDYGGMCIIRDSICGPLRW